MATNEQDDTPRATAHAGVGHSLGAGGGPVQVPARAPKDHRSVADVLDYFVDTLQLRERHRDVARRNRDQRVRALKAAGKTKEATALDKQPLDAQVPYTIDRPSPGRVVVKIHWPDGTVVGGEGSTTGKAVAAALERASVFVEADKQAAAPGARSAGAPKATKLGTEPFTDHWGRDVTLATAQDTPDAED